MYIRFEYRIDSRDVKWFSLTGSISIKYHAPIRILPRVKYAFYFLFFFFDRGKINKRWLFFSMIKTKWKSSLRKRYYRFSLSSLLFFFFVLASWSQVLSSFVKQCGVHRSVSPLFIRELFRMRVNKRMGTIDEHCSSNLRKRKKEIFVIPFAFCLANLRASNLSLCKKKWKKSKIMRWWKVARPNASFYSRWN